MDAKQKLGLGAYDNNTVYISSIFFFKQRGYEWDPFLGLSGSETSLNAYFSYIRYNKSSHMHFRIFVAADSTNAIITHIFSSYFPFIQKLSTGKMRKNNVFATRNTRAFNTISALFFWQIQQIFWYLYREEYLVQTYLFKKEKKSYN